MARNSGAGGSGGKSGQSEKLGRDPLAWLKGDEDDAPGDPGDAPPTPEASGTREPASEPDPAPQNRSEPPAPAAPEPNSQESEEAAMAATNDADSVTISRDEYEHLTRMRLAIETANQPFMMIDPDWTVRYMNAPMKRLIEEYASEISSARGVPAAEPGERLDRVFPQLRGEKAGFARLRDDGEDRELEIGDAVFTVHVTGEETEEGEFLGNTLEWDDLTGRRRRERQQSEAEDQISALIDSVREGRMDERMDTDELEGGVLRLAKNLNQLVDSVRAPLQEAIGAVNALSDGNLTQRMEGEYHGDFGALQSAINESFDNFQRIVGEIRESSNNVATSAAEISQGNQDLSQRTEEQASNLEETASSMEELTSTVKQNADNAQQSKQLAANAREQAERGGQVAQQVKEAMGAIRSSSREIADIITVIDEIAFQTNLLALNAAVEAARAGEHGRGFGVVAAEVRNLAQRSASAAKDIKSLIKDSGEKVDEGGRLVDQSSETLDEIVKSVKQVADNVNEIAAASEEQSSGIEEVNKAVTQLDEVTQQNAALVEEAAAAAESLEEQSERMRDLMSFFGNESDSPSSEGGQKKGGARHAAGKGGGAAAQSRSTGGRSGQSSGTGSAGRGGQRSGGGASAARSGGAAAGSKGSGSAKPAEEEDSEWEEF